MKLPLNWLKARAADNVVVYAKLAARAKHAVAVYAAQLCGSQGLSARQRRADGGYGHVIALFYVLRARYDLHCLRAYIYLTNPQLVGIVVMHYRFHFSSFA